MPVNSATMEMRGCCTMYPTRCKHERQAHQQQPRPPEFAAGRANNCLRFHQNSPSTTQRNQPPVAIVVRAGVAARLIDDVHPLQQRRRRDVAQGRVAQEMEQRQPGRQQDQEESPCWAAGASNPEIRCGSLRGSRWPVAFPCAQILLIKSSLLDTLAGRTCSIKFDRHLMRTAMNWTYLRPFAWVDTRARFVAGTPAGGALLDLGSSDGETLGHIAELRPDLRLFAADRAGQRRRISRRLPIPAG